ncbi:maleylpyruvate isomerase family mycothiol-dependent enzyme [Streptomyces acidicola]|uniref:Maleylpyruvate isomerase family mycothiol-dependent enzyme n=1 Tax=Streptomyces acidicola TaxID=2596892 RepID=A0A5N8WZS5_9ACTN|nr:maleylpyruvate isomerase family mycothiol-dependent enzyme [Streptomyces acidicola]MPY52837.1 maleylpyruvate isomerase family mycothiol-dependent enzyme [Streptomyces acidicola]
METAEHIETLDREGRLLVAAAEGAGTEARVPTCPKWQVRDLLRHTGTVHRWAGAFVAEGHTSYHPGEGEPDLDGAELLDWFREGHRRLVDTLTAAPADVACWSFLPAPSPLAFWARRQAHETTVHRADAESARDGTADAVGAIAPEFAVDGIDELLLAFHAREKSRVRTDRPRVLRVRATDTGTVWTVRLSSGPPLSERGETADADCEVAGPAARLYLSLWNRQSFPSITGDESPAALWREKSAVTWG